MAAAPPPPPAAPPAGFESAGAALARHWRMPQAASSLTDVWAKTYPLVVANSLTRSKVPFVPIAGKRVLWYMCGPTVYDSSHMGHARTYVCFDVLRRIMRDYFGYDVLLTMNITDIDDKIIKRSNEAGVPFAELARKYEAEFLGDMASLGVAPPDVLTRVSEYVPEIVAYIQRILANGYAYESNGSVYFDTVAYSRTHRYGKLVPENVGNAEALAEGEGVLSAPAAAPAAAAPAAASPASDAPSAAAAGAAAAGVGASLGQADKRDGSDFVLWKRSKEGEPWWPSPWGQGRPGWHIECTAMCGETLGRFTGGPIDIHSGGVDLRFPHHDNEIAQSEAYYEHQQWVNYFLHSGHLHIEGLKMSKSLKNFVKIADALERYGARQLRLFFLLQRYNAPMNYSERAMEAMASIDKTYVEFFANVKARLRGLTRGAEGGAACKWGARDLAFAAALEGVKERVYAALADDFDTPGALAALGELVRDTNKYMAAGGGGGGEAGGEAPPAAYLLKAAGDYVTGMLRTFGLVDPAPGIGFSGEGAGGAGGGGGGGGSLEATVGPFLDVLAAFRERVREAARAGGDAGARAVLAACDSLRDDMLPPLGVVLEDAALAAPPPDAGGAGSSSLWKLRDPAELRREAEDKARAAEDKARKKAEAAAEAARKAAEKEAKARLPPGELFRSELEGGDGEGEEVGGGEAAAAAGGADAGGGGGGGGGGRRARYSRFDDEGVPTHDAAGEELPKATVKKLKKEWTQQLKLHQWWLARQQGGGGGGGGDAGGGGGDDV